MFIDLADENNNHLLMERMVDWRNDNRWKTHRTRFDELLRDLSEDHFHADVPCTTGRDQHWFTPFSHKGLVCFGVSQFVQGQLDLLYFDHIYSLDKGKGLASQCLNRVCQAADKAHFDTALHLETGRGGLTRYQLEAWYKRRGFKFKNKADPSFGIRRCTPVTS